MKQYVPQQSAFPIHGDLIGRDFPPVISGGMTLRDYIAIAALCGDWAPGSEDNAWAHTTPDENLERRARLYYRMADAMMKVRVE